MTQGSCRNREPRSVLLATSLGAILQVLMHSSFLLPSFRTKAAKHPFRCSGLRKRGMLLALLVVILFLY